MRGSGLRRLGLWPWGSWRSGMEDRSCSGNRKSFGMMHSAIAYPAKRRA